jgi:phosphoribosylpyrophosphate synthetase
LAIDGKTWADLAVAGKGLADGENNIQIQENVRADVFVVQPTCTG